MLEYSGGVHISTVYGLVCDIAVDLLLVSRRPRHQDQLIAAFRLSRHLGIN